MCFSTKIQPVAFLLRYIKSMCTPACFLPPAAFREHIGLVKKGFSSTATVHIWGGEAACIEGWLFCIEELGLF